MGPYKRNDPGSGSGTPRYPGTFLLAFREAVARLNWQAIRWLGSAVECQDEHGEEHTVGLENLFRRVRREEREHWPDLIADFLTKVRTVDKNLSSPADLATIADQLLIRLGQAFTAGTGPMQVWSQPLADTGLDLNLVIDQAETMSYVTEEMVADSGRSGDEWLAKALANLQARTPADCLELVHEESGMLLCSVGDAYDSSRAMLLSHLLPAAEAYGALVALPSRDELLVLPIERLALPHLHLMKVLAEKNFKNAPYPISNEVFWIQGGRWRLFPIEIRKEDVIVQPPEEFLELLKQIDPDEEVE